MRWKIESSSISVSVGYSAGIGRVVVVTDGGDGGNGREGDGTGGGDGGREEREGGRKLDLLWHGTELARQNGRRGRPVRASIASCS